MEANGGSDFPHLLIEQATENKFFLCTVEVGFYDIEIIPFTDRFP